MRFAILTLLGASAALVSAQTETPSTEDASPASSTVAAEASSTGSANVGGGGGASSPSSSSSPSSTPPADVILRVPELSVDKIELDVDNLQAEVNLAAQVANLVELNAGVQVGVEKVNITIADVQAELDLVIRLGHLANIVNRTLSSLDLNPLLINVLDSATEAVSDIVAAVDGLLGSITDGGSTMDFLIDNLGNIVQQVTGSAGDVVSSIVGNFRDNMTYTGQEVTLGGGNRRRTYEYGELGALVNVVLNAKDQVVEARVVKGGSGDGNSGGDDGEQSTSTESASSTATAF